MITEYINDKILSLTTAFPAYTFKVKYEYWIGVDSKSGFDKNDVDDMVKLLGDNWNIDALTRILKTPYENKKFIRFVNWSIISDARNYYLKKLL